jgi:hypothetical protein
MIVNNSEIGGRAFLEHMDLSQLNKKFPAFMEPDG